MTMTQRVLEGQVALPLDAVNALRRAHGLPPLTAEQHGGAQLRAFIPHFCSVAQSSPCPVTVVVPCHNYAHFLTDCLESVLNQSRPPEKVVVIDDASNDDPQLICSEFRVPCLRVEFRNLHAVRRYGLSLCDTKYILYLDADNVIPPHFLESAVSQLEADRNAAFVFPVLMGFGDASGPVYATDEAAEIVHDRDLCWRNWCDAASVARTDALRQSGALNDDVPQACRADDWRMWRRVLESGAWYGVKGKHPLYYRVHPNQLTRSGDTTYWVDADLANEHVTIIMTLSGRWRLWRRRLQWLQFQAWPRTQTRLIVVNSSHERRTLSELGLADSDYSSILFYHDFQGRRGLGDEDRKRDAQVRQSVETAVAGLYNRSLRECQTEYALVLEDDVLGQPDDLIERMLKLVDHDVAMVSGVYEHRYHPGKAVAFMDDAGAQLLPMDGCGVIEVKGTGFGCLLLRRSIIGGYALSGDNSQRPHFDVDLSYRMRRTRWKWLLDYSIRCEHWTQGPS